jgi:hypothetical protein
MSTCWKISNGISFESLSVREVNLNITEDNIKLYLRDTGCEDVNRSEEVARAWNRLFRLI